MGGIWLAAQAGQPWNSTLIEQRARARGDVAVTEKDGDELAAAAADGVQVRPLMWWPYFQRARAELVYQNDPDTALNDFRVARFLEPMWARVPYTEGMLWEPTNHVQAVAAWRAALERQDDAPEGLWRTIFDELNAWPDGEDYACILSRARPLYRWEFLTKQVSAKRFLPEMNDEISLDPKLARYTLAQRHDLLVRWAQLDGTAAIAYLNSHPKIVNQPWDISMTALAASGRRGDALRIARENLPPVEVPQLTLYAREDEASMLQKFKDDPKDLKVGVVLLSRQLEANHEADALVTLAALAKLPDPPPFVSWKYAELLSRAGRMDEAWDAFQPYLNYERQLAAKPVTPPPGPAADSKSATPAFSKGPVY
jgi:hypothetical protein